MAQPPAYNREKNFTLNSGRETDHAALNAELDKASNSINDIRTNLAILQADDGKLRPSVVTPDSISEELRVSLVEGVVMDAQAMLDESRKASETSKSSAEKAKESETKAAASEKAATASWEQAQAIAGEVQKRADDIVQTASDQAKEYARSAQTSAQEARCVYGKIEKRADDIVEEAAREAEKQAQASAGSRRPERHTGRDCRDVHRGRTAGRLPEMRWCGSRAGNLSRTLCRHRNHLWRRRWINNV